MKRLLLFLAAFIALPVWALDVVATTSSMGMLARTVGGPQVSVTELAPPDRDAHMLQARPSMLRALRDAQLVVAVGAELEIGWLPAAIKGAANSAILPGRPGYFEAAAQVPLLDAGQAADRAQGDVHPAGNPHVSLDPLRMATIASALAERLAQLDPASAAAYRERAKHFAAAVEAKLPAWKRQAAGSGGAVLYHKDGIYLLHALGIPLHGTLEPVPGLAPTAAHLETLAGKLKDKGRKKGVIVHTPYQPPAGAEKLTSLTGWPIAVLPIDPPSGANADDYFALIDRWVAALSK
ncbi:metal ABC transporter substrate-binding protein [Pseudothauera hydrothermalis]|uniref:metal ABC transporter substrate-binding protein n=1 Tax=Pseudothauera hydrothermalis TaxID=2184083 RepID=UPI000E09D883|nr:metal ABC transporter substrate-binding protein [Pseudothauera hydrothermalis]